MQEAAQPDLPTHPLGGRYRVIRAIGHGGMGTVFEAVHVGTGRAVALKLLHFRCATDGALRARFEREARAATSVAHPNVVEVLDVGTAEDGRPFLVMELLEGESLRARLDRVHRLEVGETAYIGASVLVALGAAHGSGVVHRDVKPDNVFLAHGAPRPRVKLLDFGISKLFGPDGMDLGMTTTGTVLGTPRYMSPEQARGRPDLDHRVDVFAAGVLLYEMLAGRRPYEADSYNALVVALVEESPPPLASLRAEVPADLRDVVAAALARDRQERPSIAEILRVLRAHVPPDSLDEVLAAEPPAPRGPISGQQRAAIESATTRLERPGPATEQLVSAAAPPPRRRVLLAALALAGLAGAAAVAARVVHLGPRLRVGVFRHLTLDSTGQDAAAFPDALARALGRDVETVWIEGRFEGFAALAAGKLDLTVLDARSFVGASARTPGLDLLATTLVDGAASYHGVIVARAGRGPATLEALRGRTLCWVSPMSKSGYLFPRALLRQRGLDPDRAFGRVVYTGDHIASMQAVLAGECDAAAVGKYALGRGDAHGLATKELAVLASTEAIPYDAIVARPGLPARDRAALVGALLALRPTGALGRVTGFSRANPADYDALRRLLANEAP